MRRVFVVPAAIAAIVAADARGLAHSAVPVQSAPALGGFSVVLVIGSKNAGLSAAGIPAPAAKVLEDLKDFLPYKSYALVDSQWAVGTRGFSTTIRGPQGAYMLDVQIELKSLTRVSIESFALRSVMPQDGFGGFGGAQGGQGAQGARGTRGRPGIPPDRSIMNASFSMNIGETVVVGTSHLDGDRALIVLLTAVGKK